MDDIVIQVENLSKLYRIGQSVNYNTLRESLVNAFSAPFRHPFSTSKKGEQSLKYEYIWALKDVSFEVKQGEAVGIIGRNGAGKTTLLKVLCRITEPTEGYAEIRGRVGSLLEVGTGFHPELTGRENAYLNGAILGMKKKEIDRKFDEIVDFAGEMVKNFIDTPLKRYSSGMQVRLAFAVAAHLEPDILLIDEVLAVGDIEFQKKCLAKMQGVAQEGRTVLFISHNMSSIANLCSRAILLNRGKVELDGQVSDVVRHYIASGGQGIGGEVKWDDPQVAPGNEDVRLHSVRVTSPDGRITDSLSTEEKITIKIGYWNFKAGAKYLVNINLKDQYGGWVLTTVNTPSANIEKDPWFNLPYPAGLFESVCYIPGTLLNNQTYSIYIAIAPYEATNYPAIREENILSFTIYDSGAMAKEYSGNWLGVIRPKLHWRTEFIGERINYRNLENALYSKANKPLP